MSRFVAALLAACLALPLAAQGQGYPNKPIHLEVPYAAGGTTDIMARALQEPMQKLLGQAIVIENKAGASGIVAARDVAHSPPDGYTLFFVNNGNLSVTPQVVKNAGYDGGRDFTPVALVSSAPMFVVVPASLPVNDLKSFIDYARAQPKPLAYASAGIGSFGQLATELFAHMAGIKLVHVPYKGQGPTTNAIVSGEVQLLITTASGAMNGFISQGKLKLLAITSPEASTLAPGAPTVASVLPGYAAEAWFAIVGPAGMPADVVGRLNESFGKVLATPDVQQRFNGFGLVARTATPQRLQQLIAEDLARWTPVIRDNHIESE